jgi:hypothetical protein
VQTLAESIRIDVGDGTLMAAVKGVLGGEACGVLPCPGTAAPAPAPAAASTPTSVPPLVPGFLQLPLFGSASSSSASSDTGLLDFLTKVLGG